MGSRESNGLDTTGVRVLSASVRLRVAPLEGSCHQRFNSCTHSGALSAVGASGARSGWDRTASGDKL
ncbi:MAG: hypothetical protein KME12_17140 [Trichocoleus desertorum ATA4-8-CV12]|nr:hypothetical protein [Trichocoleus desertorum ATA4-8-CV12]